MKPTIRSNLLWLHTWSGLTLGLVILFLSVTGAAFVLRPQLEAALHHDLLIVPECSTPLPLDAFAAKAIQLHPESMLESFELHSDRRRSIDVKFENDDHLYFDPCSAALLGQQNAYAGFFGTADWLHRFWFMDKEAGKQIAGWATFAFCFALIAGGIALWWPRSWRALGNALKFNSHLPGTARTISLHKVAGLYTSIVLIALALTALPISFGLVKDGIYSATGYVAPKKPRSGPPGDRQAWTMQAQWERATALAPSWEWMSLRFAQQPDEAIQVQILEPGAPHPNAKSHLYLDAYTGAELGFSHYASDVGLGRKIYLYSIALHAGLIWGLPYQLLLLLSTLIVPVQVYSGFSPYLRRKLGKAARSQLTLRLLRRTVEGDGISSFEFVHPRGRLLPRFAAGAHIDIDLGAGVSRQYSLCNDPSERHRYVIAVLRHPASRGGSQRLHDTLREGTLVKVGTPRNHFALAATAPASSLLIAGGIGITPLLAMARELAGARREFSLHYCIRSPGQAAFVDQLEQSDFRHRVSIHRGDLGARLDVDALLSRVSTDTHVYVCGPQRLIDEVLAVCASKGWPDSQVHREYFGAAKHSTADDVAFDVRLAHARQTVHVPRGVSITAALAGCGINIPTSCSQGVCGTCITKVIDGEVEHRDQLFTTEQRARNDQMTPCCSRARGGILTLDL